MVGIQALVRLPGGVPREQTRRLDLLVHLGDLELDALEVR